MNFLAVRILFLRNFKIYHIKNLPKYKSSGTNLTTPLLWAERRTPNSQKRKMKLSTAKNPPQSPKNTTRERKTPKLPHPLSNSSNKVNKNFFKNFVRVKCRENFPDMFRNKIKDLVRGSLKILLGSEVKIKLNFRSFDRSYLCSPWTVWPCRRLHP